MYAPHHFAYQWWYTGFLLLIVADVNYGAQCNWYLLATKNLIMMIGHDNELLVKCGVTQCIFNGWIFSDLMVRQWIYLLLFIDQIFNCSLVWWLKQSLLIVTLADLSLTDTCLWWITNDYSIRDGLIMRNDGQHAVRGNDWNRTRGSSCWWLSITDHHPEG